MPNLLVEREEQVTRFKNEQIKVLDGQYKEQIDLLNAKIIGLKENSNSLKDENQNMIQ
jgi:hypothetical protein